MPRPERALDPSAGPVQQFASELRALREKAGSPKYLAMARATGRSKTALTEAAGGDHLATWETVAAYVTACGGDPAQWSQRWEQVRAEVEHSRAPQSPPPMLSAAGPVDEGPAHPRRTAWPRRRWLIAAGLLALAAGSALTGAALAAGSGTPVAAGGGAVTVVVQNKVASGPNGFYEDTTPEYLSAKTEPMCSRQGCELPDTKMWSGAVLRALCQTQGTVITNANTHSDGIASNPNAFSSTRWYKVEMPTGVTGYIAEAYLTPASRGGLGLPACQP